MIMYRILAGTTLILALLLTGCRSNKELVLLQPGDTAVWRTVDTAAMNTQNQEAIRLEVRTSLGAFIVELYDDAAPETVENFLTYVENDFYDRTIFHRVIPGFMIQGGGFTVEMEQKSTRESINNEADNGLRNRRGTLAMARTNDLDSATSQFFINLVDNGFLDGDGVTGGYAVFGRVYRGMDVVDRIAQVNTRTRGMYEHVPVEPVIIENIRVIN